MGQMLYWGPGTPELCEPELKPVRETLGPILQMRPPRPTDMAPGGRAGMTSTRSRSSP